MSQNKIPVLTAYMPRINASFPYVNGTAVTYFIETGLTIAGTTFPLSKTATNRGFCL